MDLNPLEVISLWLLYKLPKQHRQAFVECRVSLSKYMTCQTTSCPVQFIYTARVLREYDCQP